MIVVFAGSIGRFPVGGHAWVDLQYLLGLRELGCDVYYLEECGDGSWVYHWEAEEVTTDLDYPTSYLSSCLKPLGFADRWMYRAGDCSVGMPIEEMRDVCRTADLLIIRACPLDRWREEYSWPRRRVFIDSDPCFTQVKLIRGHETMSATVDKCETVFTVGGRVGRSDCTVPTAGREWIPMPPPVFLPEWPIAADAKPTHFTTVMQWQSYDEIVHEGTRYGNKNLEFPAFIDLPQRTAQPLRLAVSGLEPEKLAAHGWDAVTGWREVWTPDMYREFVQGSRAELSLAKHGYVVTRGGWMSDRTSCYLASARPALIQDTGLGDWIPVGEGLLTFRDPEEALRGIDEINADYEAHSAAARSLAEEYLSASRVIERLLEISAE